MDVLRFRHLQFPELLIPSGNFLNVPVGHITHHIWFYFFDIDGSPVVDVFKIGFTIISLQLIVLFFRLFVSVQNAWLISLLFIFFPSHDAIPYWYAPSGHLLSIAFYLFAYYLAHHQKYVGAFCLALIASFMVYGSTPVALALFTLSLLHKKVKQAFLLLVPNLLYAAYFLYLTVFSSQAPSRILEPVSFTGFLKQFALQVATFVDAGLGPSMCLKLYFSVREISWLSFLVGLGIAVWLWRSAARGQDDKLEWRLLVCLSVLALASFVMFSATGRYPQLAFNLGNRTTFWGSLLLAYLIVLIPTPRVLRWGLLSLMAFACLGISDHWKAWNLHQQAVLERIGANEELRGLPEGSTVYVSGNQYSKLGPISHIEFLSEDWVPRAIFALLLEQALSVKSMNRNLVYREGSLFNKKTSRRVPVRGALAVYDSEADKIVVLNPEEINDFIDSLPEERRHWSQFADNAIVKHLKELGVFLMPRLKGTL